MICAALLAGGIGTRLDVGMPKQFYLIAGKPILIHSLEAFLKVEEMDEIIVSSPKECVNKTKDVIKEYDLTDPRITDIDRNTFAHYNEDHRFTKCFRIFTASTDCCRSCVSYCDSCADTRKSGCQCSTHIL